MNLHGLKWKKESIPVALLGAAVVFVVLILIQVTSFLEASARVQNTIKKAVAQDKPNPEATRESTAASQTVAQELKKHNLFSPLQPPRHPVTSVLGILGGEALIGNKWYKAGDMIGDAKIISVEPTRVRVLWRGHEKVFVPMDVAGQPGTSTTRPVRRVFRPHR
jgi:Na+-transporting methylmalonyl-CoA/oxaloacetate decarboxylase gamma subunit